MCKMKNISFPFVTLFLFVATISFAQAPAGYYTAAEGQSGEALRTALYNIIKTHTTLSYNQLWQSFYTTDARPDNGKVWDMYSDRPGGTPAYYFTFGSDQCGNYSGEGDCYNREHSVPKSWFGGSTPPMYTDLFHLIPTDGFVNSKRGNLPIGKVINATWTSSNGSKWAPPTFPVMRDRCSSPSTASRAILPVSTSIWPSATRIRTSAWRRSPTSPAETSNPGHNSCCCNGLPSIR